MERSQTCTRCDPLHGGLSAEIFLARNHTPAPPRRAIWSRPGGRRCDGSHATGNRRLKCSRRWDRECTGHGGACHLPCHFAAPRISHRRLHFAISEPIVGRSADSEDYISKARHRRGIWGCRIMPGTLPIGSGSKSHRDSKVTMESIRGRKRHPQSRVPRRGPSHDGCLVSGVHSYARNPFARQPFHNRHSPQGCPRGKHCPGGTGGSRRNAQRFGNRPDWWLCERRGDWASHQAIRAMGSQGRNMSTGSKFECAVHTSRGWVFGCLILGHGPKDCGFHRARGAWGSTSRVGEPTNHKRGMMRRNEQHMLIAIPI
mmetsp:Transcript_11921/g.30240  ORF Transcript_11921/g.30240 Transcript_11921/m.30240 type:complete len:315 (-) Transcript_11921:47-991(-)